MRDEGEPPSVSRHNPTGDLLLAQALEACIRAERRRPGAADEVIAHAPPSTRAELRRLIKLVRTLQHVSPGGEPSAEFRQAARERLLRHIRADVFGDSPPRLTAVASVHGRRMRRRMVWMARIGGVMLATIVASLATLSASASALPGDPLYGVKKAQEELNLRLAVDDQARVLSILQHADVRLDETSRLLDAGRTRDAASTTQQYDQAIERATTTYVVTLEAEQASPESIAPMQNKLDEEQQHLQQILQVAPEPVRGDLREALVTTERGRQLVADPQPLHRALGRPPSEPVPVVAAEAPVPSPHEAPPQTTAPPEPTQIAHADNEHATASDDAAARAPHVLAQASQAPRRLAPAAPVATTRRQNRGRGSEAKLVEPAPAAIEAHDDGSSNDGDDRPPAVARVDGNGRGGAPVASSNAQAHDGGGPPGATAQSASKSDGHGSGDNTKRGGSNTPSPPAPVVANNAPPPGRAAAPAAPPPVPSGPPKIATPTTTTGNHGGGGGPGPGGGNVHGSGNGSSTANNDSGHGGGGGGGSGSHSGKDGN